MQITDVDEIGHKKSNEQALIKAIVIHSELIVPLEEPHPLAEHKPEPVQPATDLAQAMEHVYKTSPTFPSNKDLEPTGKRYTSVREMVVDTCPEILEQFDGTTRNIHNMTFLTQDGKEYTVPPGLMRDLVTIYGEKTVEQELLKIGRAHV